MSITTITENRICTILRQILYSMSDEENKEPYVPLKLIWECPSSGIKELFPIIKNVVFVLGYVQKHRFSKEHIDSIIENDIKPMVNGLKDEMDFIIACVIIVISSVIDDYSDPKELIDISKKIIGKIIYMLEKFETQSSLQTIKINSEQEVDTTGLEIGMFIPKGYKELCGILNERALKSGSNSYKAQLKRWARYFKMEKGRGRSLVIIDIYDEPLPPDDGRKNGNRNIYLKYIETILLRYIYYMKGQVCYATRNQLWLILGMINNSYRKIPLRMLQTEVEYCDVTDWELNKFYMRCNAKLNTILFSALNNLCNRSLITYEVQTMIVVPDQYKKGFSRHYVADDNEVRKILAVERNILNKMGFESKNHAACCMKLTEFYSAVNERLFELYGWERKYERLKIIFNEKDIKDAITKNEYELQMMYLNEIIIDTMDKNAQAMVDNRMKKALYEYEQYLTEWKENNWGEPPKIEEVKEIFTYPKYFVDIQKRLSQKFLVIKPKEDQQGMDLYSDKELDELFSKMGLE